MTDSFRFPPSSLSRYHSSTHPHAGSSIASSPNSARDTPSTRDVSRERSRSTPRRQADQMSPLRAGKLSLDLPRHPLDQDRQTEDCSDEWLHPGYTTKHNAPPPHPQTRPSSSRSTSSHYSDSAKRVNGDLSKPVANGQSDSSKSRSLAGFFKRKISNAASQPCNGAATAIPSKPHSKTVRRIVQPTERTVVVEHGKSRLKVTVSATTTALDIIQHASKHWPNRINPKSTVLLEYFISIGIQRPLRQFERVRDVMNSWAHDRQNYFILIDPGTGGTEAELTIAGILPPLVAKQSWVLEYSQKVGKWDKRIVTLHPSGLLTQAARSNDVDTARTKQLGHLGGFDIYVPTPAKVRGKIKPPRRFCFAIKSQRVMSTFDSLCEYVHFFCTHDRQTADAFYAAVQGWRSRYLVGGLHEDVKGKGGDGVPCAKETPPKAEDVATPLSVATRMPFIKSASQFDTSLSPERRGGAMNFAVVSTTGGGSGAAGRRRSDSRLCGAAVRDAHDDSMRFMTQGRLGSTRRRANLERADPRGGKVGRGVAM